jgi:hypothetical protein
VAEVKCLLVIQCMLCQARSQVTKGGDANLGFATGHLDAPFLADTQEYDWATLRMGGFALNFAPMSPHSELQLASHRGDDLPGTEGRIHPYGVFRFFERRELALQQDRIHKMSPALQ